MHPAFLSLSEALWAPVSTGILESTIREIQKLCGKMACAPDVSMSND